MMLSGNDGLVHSVKEKMASNIKEIVVLQVSSLNHCFIFFGLTSCGRLKDLPKALLRHAESILGIILCA